MPSVIFKGYRIQRTVSVSQTYSEAKVEAVQLTHYDSYERRIKHISDNGAKYLLVIKCKRYKCKHCGRVYRQELEGILPYKRISERYANMLVAEYNKNVCNKTIAHEYRVSESTVERAIHKRYSQKLKEQLNYECPSIIGMRAAEQETSNGKGMYEEYKGTENNDETDEIRSDTGV